MSKLKSLLDTFKSSILQFHLNSCGGSRTARDLRISNDNSDMECLLECGVVR